MTWDVAVPAGSDNISLGDDAIREFKTDVQTALRGNAATGTEAIFPGSDTANPVFRYRGLKGTTAARPAFGQYGLYINETLNTIQRDSGSAWVDVATHIPSGTRMVFYQAAAPTGWTAVAVNDKFLRVVTAGGTGGTDGGTVAASTSLAHTHTLAHTHDMGNHTHTGPSHTHTVGVGGWGSADGAEVDGVLVTTNGGGAITDANLDNADTAKTTSAGGTGNTGAPSANTSGAASGETTSSTFAGAFAYSDVIVATKD